jgi:hypothetical protein
MKSGFGIDTAMRHQPPLFYDLNTELQGQGKLISHTSGAVRASEIEAKTIFEKGWKMLTRPIFLPVIFFQL